MTLPPLNISGTFPHLAVKAGHSPDRTETGIGALMPWADRLWFVTYLAHKAKLSRIGRMSARSNPFGRDTARSTPIGELIRWRLIHWHPSSR